MRSKLGVKASTKSVSPERQESFSDSRARRQGSWRLDPEAKDLGIWPWTPQNFLLRFPKTLWDFPFGPNKVFSYPKHIGKHPETLPVNSGTLPVNSRTLPETKHYYPIYQSLSPDHSGVPRHVLDLIPDSEQHSVTNIHNSYNTIVNER